MNEGKRFEDNFKKSIPDNVYWLRLTDSSPAGFGGNENMRFSIQSPFDFILYANGKMYALELKSTQGKSVSFVGKSAMIKEHQIEALRHARQYVIIAGFILNFRGSGTYFLSIDDFDNFKEERNSIPLSYCKTVGIELPEKRLKVNSRYDLTNLLGV